MPLDKTKNILFYITDDRDEMATLFKGLEAKKPSKGIIKRSISLDVIPLAIISSSKNEPQINIPAASDSPKKLRPLPSHFASAQGIGSSYSPAASRPCSVAPPFVTGNKQQQSPRIADSFDKIAVCNPGEPVGQE